MKILIKAAPNDTCALYVKLALEAQGNAVALLAAPDNPQAQKNSIFVNDLGYQWQGADKYDNFQDNGFDVVWWRSPNAGLGFLQEENRLFFEEIRSNLALSASWVNDRAAAVKVSSKLFVLRMARASGMNVPETLCSNNPLDIRHFLLEHETEGVYCQALHTHTQCSPRKISFLDLANNQALQGEALLYQKAVKNLFAIKIVCFGDTVLAVQLENEIEDHIASNVKPFIKAAPKVELHTLPRYLHLQVSDFMEKCGLVFACFDFIMNDSGEYVFVSLEEQGDFLWIEACNPKIKILDSFTQFLLKQSKGYQEPPQKKRHSLEDYREQVEMLCARNRLRYAVNN